MSFAISFYKQIHLIFCGYKQRSIFFIYLAIRKVFLKNLAFVNIKSGVLCASAACYFQRQ